MKLTPEQVAIYASFGGDEDGFSRVATKKQRATMKGVDWSIISELLQGLGMVARGLASAQFEQDLVAKMVAMTTDETARAALKKLAE